MLKTNIARMAISTPIAWAKTTFVRRTVVAARNIITKDSASNAYLSLSVFFMIYCKEAGFK